MRIFILSWMACASLTASAQDFADEGWGDLGYSKPQAIVEPMPSAEIAAPEGEILLAAAEDDIPLALEPVNPVERTAIGSPVPKTASVANRRTGRVSNVSTLQNTHGVLTVEQKPAQFYLSPFGGMSDVVGNSTVTSTPRFAVGIQGGVLLSSSFLLSASYTYSDQALSLPREGSPFAGFFVNSTEAFNYRTNHVELGGRLYILGRESRVRPFFGGGFGWGKHFLNYAAANLQAVGYQPGFVQDMVLNQWNGFGELGTEVAITRALAIQLAFKFRGVLGVTTSVNSPEGSVATESADVTKQRVSDSISRNAAYTLGAGLSVVF